MKIETQVSKLVALSVKPFDRCRALLIFAALQMATLAVQAQVTHFDSPAQMNALEDQGYSLSDMLIGQSKLSNYELIRSPRRSGFQLMTNIIQADQNEMIENLKKVDTPYTTKIKHHYARIFDLNWMQSKFANFKLVGVINRVDRQDFSQCGETRLIYRLAYDLKEGQNQMSSTLPFTMNLIFDNPKSSQGNCLTTLQRWNGSPQDVTEFVKWAKAGILNLNSLSPKQLEVNIQILRIPSESARDFGGQASYLMRVFDWKKISATESSLKIKTMENTPDVEKLNADSGLRMQLLNWIKSHLGQIDMGVFLIPDQFLATKSVSVSTYGAFRLQNKLFEQIFKENELGQINYENAAYVNSNQALLERLSSSTCIGCHQNGSVAGFHFLGKDADSLHDFNRLVSGYSPHFFAEVVRRKSYYTQQMRGETPSIFRPLSMAPPLLSLNERKFREADLGMACTLDSRENNLKEPIRCRNKTEDGRHNVSCQRVANNQQLNDFFGVCLEEPNQIPSGGMSCLAGDIEEKNGIYESRLNVKDFMYQLEDTLNDKIPICQMPVSGVPGGLVLRNCRPDEEKFENIKPGQPIPNEICGMRAGKRFDECASTGVFSACLSVSTARGTRSTCTENRGCRADYICQKFPDSVLGSKKEMLKGVGFCTPTYFIYQLRLDGHPDPLVGTKGSVLEKVYDGVWK